METDKQKTKVSVIIPTYNREKVLSRAVKSVLNQTFTDFEILVVDDGSTDNTKNIIQELQRQDKRIKYFRYTPNKGGNVARNLGIKKSIGKYIAFLDSDDEWLPEGLEERMKIFDQLPDEYGLVYCQSIKKKLNSEQIIPKRGIKENESVIKYLFKNNGVFSTCTLMIKSALLKENHLYFDENLKRHQDWDFVIRLADKTKFYFLDKVLSIWHNEEQEGRVSMQKDYSASFYLIEKYKDKFEKEKDVWAKFYYKVGVWNLWQRELKEARRVFKSSLKIKIYIKSLFLYISTFLGKQWIDFLFKLLYYKIKKIENGREKNNKKKIFFLIPSFRGGGAERIVLNVVNNLDKNKFDVGLITISEEGEYRNLLSKEIKHFDLGKKRARRAILELIKLLRKERPNVVVGAVTQSTIILYLASFFIPNKIKIINRLEIFYSKSIGDQKFIQRKLFQKALEKSDYIITISNEMRNNLIKNIKISKDHVKMIYNPIDINYVKKETQEEMNGEFPFGKPIIIACGRLTKQKGFNYLIYAFKKVKRNYPEAKLLILGQGELKKELQKLTQSLELEKSVHFLGFQENPFKYIANSDIFVLSSLWEGLPTTLIEAMICGTPVVSTNCPSGPKEILKDGKCGVLVNVGDSQDLVKGIMKLLQDKELQKKYKEQGRQRANAFSIEKIIKEYDNFLCENKMNLQ